MLSYAALCDVFHLNVITLHLRLNMCHDLGLMNVLSVKVFCE